MKAQVTGNVGLYRVCAKLSELGFNVMPTARNAKGVDIVGYDEHGKAFTVQVKTLTKRNAIAFGGDKNHIIADYLVAVVLQAKWEGVYIWIRKEMRKAKISKYTGKDGKEGHWLESKTWTKDTAARNAWEKIAL